VTHCDSRFMKQRQRCLHRRPQQACARRRHGSGTRQSRCPVRRALHGEAHVVLGVHSGTQNVFSRLGRRRLFFFRFVHRPLVRAPVICSVSLLKREKANLPIFSSEITKDCTDPLVASTRLCGCGTVKT